MSHVFSVKATARPSLDCRSGRPEQRRRAEAGKEALGAARRSGTRRAGQSRAQFREA
jgi:hypothetical protein